MECMPGLVYDKAGYAVVLIVNVDLYRVKSFASCAVLGSFFWLVGCHFLFLRLARQ